MTRLVFALCCFVLAITARSGSAAAAPIEVRARFLIGCDGGRSTVRKAIGATFVGTPVTAVMPLNTKGHSRALSVAMTDTGFVPRRPTVSMLMTP